MICSANHSPEIMQRYLDLFGGSGSTLIACEQTGRKMDRLTGRTVNQYELVPVRERWLRSD